MSKDQLSESFKFILGNLEKDEKRIFDTNVTLTCASLKVNKY